MVRPVRNSAVYVCVALTMLLLPAIAGTAAAAPAKPSAPSSVSSSPPDRSVYRQPASPTRPALAAPAAANGVATLDPAVLASANGGGEPSIAVNPANPKQIAISRFTFQWDSNADFLYSSDGGITWTEEATIPPPPGLSGSTAGCPCDQTLDFGRDGRLYGTFLTCTPGGSGCSATQVVSGSTSDPTQASAWSWNGSPAQLTSGTRTGADQPWLLVNRDPVIPGQDNVYVAYDDFGGSPDARVAVSKGVTPTNFAVDNKAGTEAPSSTNPGLRMATDPNSGAVYVLYEQSTGSTQPKSVTYMLNRSTDGGTTWTLNGSTDGLAVDTVNSDQAPGFKFGGVNALLGGVDHAAVDPTTGDVYVVYGQDVAGGNQINIRRLTDNGAGGLTIGTAHTVSTATDTALPSVAVLTDGTIGVLYISYDGTPVSGFPNFSAHLARSTDHGVTFSDVTLQAFASPALPDNSVKNGPRQRVFGDYDQIKAVGKTFYGVYSGNASSFGGSAQIDPIFFSVPQATKTSLVSSANPSAFGQPVHFTATVAPVPDGGNVNVTVDGTPLGGAITVNTTTGVATSPDISTLTVGPHSVMAVYTGNDNFTTSSAALTQTVQKAPTNTALGSSVNPSNYGAPLTFTATVTPAPPSTNPAVLPTGSVAFAIDGTPITTRPLDQPTGTASFSFPSLLPGSHLIRGDYSGDANFLPSFGTLTQVVTCTNNITGKHPGGLILGPGSTCVINAQIGGAILAGSGSSLFVQGSNVQGAITTNGAASIAVCSTTIGGGLSVQRTSGFVLVGDPLDDGCAGNTVLRGTATFSNNAGDVEVSSNNLPALSINGTTGTGPFPDDTRTEIESNHVAGSVGCVSNSPAPSNDGHPNTVAGARTGQCSSI